MMSSLKLVPPVVTITLILVCLASSIQICDVCSANSLVGTNTRAIGIMGQLLNTLCTTHKCTQSFYFGQHNLYASTNEFLLPKVLPTFIKPGARWFIEIVLRKLCVCTRYATIYRYIVYRINT